MKDEVVSILENFHKIELDMLARTLEMGQENKMQSIKIGKRYNADETAVEENFAIKITFV